MTYVYKKDGKYFKNQSWTTHTGQHSIAEWTDDINEATTYHTMPNYRTRQDYLLDCEKVEVTVVRYVVEK